MMDSKETPSGAIGIVDRTRSYYDVLMGHERVMEALPTVEGLNAERTWESSRPLSVLPTRKNKRNVTLENSGYNGHMSFLKTLDGMQTAEELNAERTRNGWQDVFDSWSTTRPSTHVWTH